MSSREAVWGSPRDHRDLGVFAISSERRVDYERKAQTFGKRCHPRVSVQPAQNAGAYRGLDRDPRKIENLRHRSRHADGGIGYPAPIVAPGVDLTFAMLQGVRDH